MSATRVYVANAASGTLTVLALDPAKGALQTLQTVAIGGMAMPIAISPDRCYLHVARRSAPLAVLSFEIDRRSGQLMPLGETALAASMAYLACDGSGRWLLAASYQGEQLALLAIGKDGRPQAARQSIATGASAHALLAGPGNRHAYATVLGADQVWQFSLDAAQGRLAALQPATLAARPGAGPRHLVFHPSAPWAYLINELDAGIDRLAVDAASGQLSYCDTVWALPPGCVGAPWAAEIRLSPDGRFLYASERRSSTVSGFAIDTANGRLSPLGHWPTQAQPRGMAIDPSGRWLLVAGQLSHRLGVHRVDADSGQLSAVAEHEVGQDPNWVEAIALPER